MVFVDWLSISKNHTPGSLPVVGSEVRLSHDIDSGELLREQVIGKRHAGSFDTSLHIRSDASRVTVDGNPSAFDRPDNLFGLPSVAAGVDKINSQLATLSLPVFDSIKPDVKFSSTVHVLPVTRRFDSSNGMQSARSDSLLADSRSRLSRVDVTENLCTDDPVAFIRHLSGYCHHGKCGHLYPNGRTVEWGAGSRRIYIKFYDKAFDIEQKIKALVKRLASKNRDNIQLHISYLTQLHTYCVQNGIVRLEVTFKSTELTDRNLFYIEDWEGHTMSNVLAPYQFHKKINVEETRFDGVFSHLLSLDYSDRISRQAELIHTSWVNGSDVKALCGSKESYYRYRRILLNVGVDIFTPCDISRITLRAHKSSWSEAQKPDWYDSNMLKLSKLSLVA